MAWTPPRRAVSTATTITVNSNALPSWAPGLGEYADVSLTTPQATSGVDPCPTNTCVYTGVEGQSAIWNDWNGFAFAPSMGTMGSMLLHGGGHAGYYGNEVLRYDVASRVFTRLNNPSLYAAYSSDVDVYGSFPDGAPNPIHTYNNFEYVPSDAGGGSSGSVIFMHRPNSNSTVTFHHYWKFDIASLTWTHGPDALASRTSQSGTNRCALVYDSNRKGIWKLDYSEFGLASLGVSFYSLQTGDQYALSLNSGNSFTIGAGSGTLNSMITYHPGRDFLLAHTRNTSTGVRGLVCIDLSGYTLGVSSFAPTHTITTSGTAHPLVVQTDGQERLEYCSYDGNFYAINWPTDARLYKLTVPVTLTDTWVWSSELLTPKSGTSSLAFTTRSNDNCLFGKFRYVPAIKSFMWSDGIDKRAQAGRPQNFF